MQMLKSQVGIIGAGPAGLMLAHLLHKQGTDCVVLEARSRHYVEERVRAGVLEQGTVDLLDQCGMGARMHRQGLSHQGIELAFEGIRHRIDFSALTKKSVLVYGQHEVVKDLIAGAEAAGIPVLFDVQGTSPTGCDGGSPSITFECNGSPQTLRCEFVAGCDGFHGVSRAAVPAGVFKTFEHVYPYSWLGILADAAPSQEELVYMHHVRGFALFSMRSAAVTRLYLQCATNTDVNDWSDDQIWSELLVRLTCNDGWRPNTGRILQKSVTPMRSFVTEPMQFGRLYLAGDAVHIVPPTGAKGMNLAISDVKVLAEGFEIFYREGSTRGLDRYSEVCLRRVWGAQRFSWMMTSLLHRDTDSSQFEYRRQIADLRHVVGSTPASQALAESYVGLPIESVL